jgi:cell division protein FtsA
MSVLLPGNVTLKMRPLHAKRGLTVSALDIGSHKIVCLIARLTPRDARDVLRNRTHAVEILGFGHVRARGVKSGAIVNIAQAEQAIRHAVDAAERMAGVQLESVILSLSAGRLASERFSASVQVADAQVSDGDVSRVLAAGSQYSAAPDRAILHSLPTGYALDGNPAVMEPRGMIGRDLQLTMHVASADLPAVRNLMLAVERCHIGIEAVVAGPYAAGLSVLSDDEPDLGVTVIDLGAGTTTAGVFAEGAFVHADSIAVGGLHVTMDLARGLSTQVAEAERIKTLHGNVMGGSMDDRDMIAIPPVGDDSREPPANVPRAMLTRIIRPRVEEILEFMRDRLTQAGYAPAATGRVVLTGGGSQLSGLVDLASDVFGARVRIGRPLGLAAMPDMAKTPAFAAAAGLAVYPQLAGIEHFETRRTRRRATGTDGYFGRIGQWLRDSF